MDQQAAGDAGLDGPVAPDRRGGQAGRQDLLRELSHRDLVGVAHLAALHLLRAGAGHDRRDEQRRNELADCARVQGSTRDRDGPHDPLAVDERRQEQTRARGCGPVQELAPGQRHRESPQDEPRSWGDAGGPVVGIGPGRRGFGGSHGLDRIRTTWPMTADLPVMRSLPCSLVAVAGGVPRGEASIAWHLAPCAIPVATCAGHLGTLGPTVRSAIRVATEGSTGFRSPCAGVRRREPRVLYVPSGMDDEQASSHVARDVDQSDCAAAPPPRRATLRDGERTWRSSRYPHVRTMYSQQLLDPIPIVGVFLLIAAILLAVFEVGYRVGRWWQEKTPDEKEGPTSMLVGSLLALMAFLLAVTMGMAVDRFDTRRSLVLDEANAIGTTYLRAGYLPAAVRGREPEAAAGVRPAARQRGRPAAAGRELRPLDCRSTTSSGRGRRSWPVPRPTPWSWASTSIR